MRKNPVVILYILGILLFTQCTAYTQKSQNAVQTGIEVLTETGFDILKGKKVGLITNPTGVNKQLKSTIDILYEAKEVELVALYGPEHGVRGDMEAGKMVQTKTDPKTGLNVYSLYGKTKKPTPEMLKGIDVLVYDIQDIGCRSYTYITTMGLAMEAAAENNIEFIVLDRPNPLGGQKVEGMILEESFKSMVGAYPIPYVYGLSCGELARMINGENWLNTGKRCKLKVVKMKNWDRSMVFDDTGLPWVPSSPHIPDARKAFYYVATGILGELSLFNIGVGYTLPFELIANDFMNPDLIVGKLNTFYEGDILFRPITFKPYYGKDAQKVLHGIQVYVIHPEKASLLSVQFKFLEVFHSVYPNVDVASLSSDRHNMFDKVNGSSKIREIFFQRYKFADIDPLFKKDIAAFKNSSSKYFLY